jgi:hypothetical protein
MKLMEWRLKEEEKSLIVFLKEIRNKEMTGNQFDVIVGLLQKILIQLKKK